MMIPRSLESFENWTSVEAECMKITENGIFCKAYKLNQLTSSFETLYLAGAVAAEIANNPKRCPDQLITTGPVKRLEEVDHVGLVKHLGLK